VQHTVALNHEIGVIQHVLTIRMAEVPLARAEHHGHDVHRHNVDPAERKRLGGDLAG